MKTGIKKNIALLVVFSLILSMFAGCTAKDDKGKESVSEGSLSETGKNTDKEIEADEAYDPLGKYDEPVTITTSIRTFGDNFAEFEGSKWDELFRSYGINVEVEWSADASQYDSKVNTVIASGDIPDLMQVISTQPMTTLIKGEMVYDIGELIQYMSPELQERLAEDVYQQAMESVTYKEKISLLPKNVTELLNNSFPLFIRKDWVDKLGMEMPENIEDFEKIALAFTENDPDGNGKDDTYGLALMGQSNMVVDWGGLFGFFAGYGVQPCVWYDGMIFYSEDSNGEVVWDGERPEVKEGLQLLQNLYSKGAIAADFPTVDGSRIMEELNGGKAGMVFGVRGLPIWAINKTVLNDPDAEWYAINMPTKEGVDATIFGFQPVSTGYAVSADCENPEAIAKLLNITMSVLDPRSPNYDPSYDDPSAGPKVIDLTDPSMERIENLAFFEAVESGDTSNLNALMLDRYEKVMAYEETKDPELWPLWSAFYPGEGHSWYLTFAQNDISMIKRNLWWSLPTDSMMSYLPIYKKMAEETMTRIITGNADIDEWDTLIKDWNNLGGEQITQEVIESLK